ncbi:M48 family metallopeptidase [Corallococcus exercitus]|uniref:M48 family metallopeptidase n=1 Tax=Corallococcus exercitus TaxID=2316736 RepID=UPI0035D4E6C0
MANVNPSSFQSTLDRKLRTELLADKDVKWALQRVDKVTTGLGFTARRRLLANSLRLTRSMAPAVAEALADCKEMLGYDKPVEVFVKPDPMINASAVHNPSGHPLIVLSSRLIEVFTEAELRFVMGHELGHLTFEHFAIPMPVTAIAEDAAGVIVPRHTALKLYLWCRAAEVSADRAGLLCGKDPDAAASGFFKLASGLASGFVKPDLEAYSRQVDSLVSAPSARAKPRDDDDTLDCFSTHPFSPLRVRAVVAFSKSKTYRALVGHAEGGEGLSDEEVDSIIERDFREMDASYLEEQSPHAELLRRALFLGGLLVAHAHEGVSERELQALAALLGSEHVGVLPSIDAARRELTDVAARVREKAPTSERARLLQHLTLVAAADGNVAEEEFMELQGLAAALSVPVSLVDETLRGAAHPLD